MELKRLGDYVKIKTGKLDANASSENGMYPFFTCSVNNLRIDNFAYDCECILIAGNGDLNVKYYEGKFNAYQRTYIVESNDKSVLDVRFLYYFMNKYIDILRKNSIGGVIKYIKLGDLTEAFIPIPSLEIQKKIVVILDKAQGLIDARKEQIKLMDELIHSVFYENFGNPVKNSMGWKVDKLDKHVISIDSGWSPKCLNNKAPKSKWGVLKLSAVTGGMYNEEQNKELPKELEPRTNLEIKKGDLLITRKNTPELVGDCCYVFETRDKLMMPDIIFRINTQHEINRIFLWALFNNHTFKQRIKLMASGSAKSMVNISKAKLKDLEIIVPDYKLQLKFSTELNQIEEKKMLIKESLYELENCFESIVHRAFRGELR